MGCITKQKRGSSTRYLYTESFREKLDPSDSGKVKGTGKSKVRTRQVWLGTAEEILAKFQERPKDPVRARSYDYGIPVAAWDLAQRLGLVEILDRWMPKRKQGLSTGAVMVLTAISRLGQPTSKEGLGEWYGGTSLVRIAGGEGKELDSAAWWREADGVLSERELTEAKEAAGYGRGDKIPWKEWEGLMKGEVIEGVEQAIWERVAREYNIPLDVVLYDLTNFYTHSGTQVPATLLEYGANKQERDGKLQVGMAVGCVRELGIPVMHEVYAGNENDVTLLPTAIRTLVKRYEAVRKGTEKLLVVLDAGNNKKGVYEDEKQPVEYLGVLKRSEHGELMDVGLQRYEGRHGKRQYYETTKRVYGRECRVVVTYSAAREGHELRGFNHRIEGVKGELRKVWRQYWGEEEGARTRGRLDQVLREQQVQGAQARRYVEYEIEGNALRVRRRGFECREKRKQFGKRVLFTNRMGMRAEEMIELDGERRKVEDVFKELKDRSEVSMWPIRNWTDTKIRMHAFCCVLGLLLLKLLLLEAEQAGLSMSARVWLLAMGGIREAYLVYPDESGGRVLEKNSPLAEQLSELYGLDRYF